MVLRMTCGYPLKGFVGEPANPLELILNQQPSVYGNSHGRVLMTRAK